MKRLTRNLHQNLIYAIIWLLVFAFPVAVYYQSGEGSWNRALLFWIRVAPFFVLFIINNCLLVPRLMMRRRWGWYGAAVAAVILVLFAVIQPPVAHALIDSLIEGETGRMPPPPGVRPPMHPGGPPGHMPMAANDALIAILVVGFNIAIRYLFKSMRDERQIRELEALGLEAELNYLKAQINPHFFMNTLNNIHALVDIDGERAKESVIELSKIMRYVLYEVDMPRIGLGREIAFIENYVSLQRIRFPDGIDIRIEFPDPVPEVRVPPMLLITLVENAFKHGVSYRHDSFIHARLEIVGERLVCSVSNSIGEVGSEGPGVGLENMRKRLGLLFGENGYTLAVMQTVEKYSVSLEIPLV